MNGMPQPQVTLMLEISAFPTDCHLNHKLNKRALKSLMDLSLVEVETRRCSAWKRDPDLTGLDNAQRLRAYEDWGSKIRARNWVDRSEIHARFTDDGFAWHDEWKREAGHVG